MTARELQIEYAYRKAEREALLCDGGTPTLSQCYLAEQEAQAACDELKRQETKTITNQNELLL